MTLLYKITTLSLLISASNFAQIASQASLGTINRPTPKIGFNTNGHMPANFPSGNMGANFTQQSFIDSTASLNPGILRFPGGTNANHWDWKTGWYKQGYLPPFPALKIRPEEFQIGLNATNAEGLYVLNLETSTVDYEMDGLRHLKNLGLNPTMVELGNEHNLANSTYPLQFMTSSNYAQMCKTWYDSIKLVLPNSKVCVVGSNTGQRPTWHSDILKSNPKIDAFAWHAYLNADNKDLVFNVNRALAVAFGDINTPQSLADRYKVGGFDV